MQDTEATEQLPDIDAQVKMHDGELDIDATLVKRLLMAQFPALADQPLAIVHSTGTVNAVYRLGHDCCVRLSRMPAWAEGLEEEWQWLPVLAPQLSLAIPKPLALGAPTAWYPYPWAIYNWIEGLPYRDELIRDEREAALDLVKFIGELRQ
ncbi:MAG: phosphotransferase, partial [Caldilineaceae bacterium]|nr:phosphotransferase [Caldilineaceae bacterium]